MASDEPQSEEPDPGADGERPVLRYRELTRPLATIGWAAFFAGGPPVTGLLLSGDRESVNINCVGVAALVALLVGLSRLPVVALGPAFRRRRDVVLALVAVELAASAAFAYPAFPRGLLIVAAQAVIWTWQLLLIVFMGDLMAHLARPDLAAPWRRLTRAWLAFAIASVTTGVALTFAVREDEPTGGGWVISGTGWRIEGPIAVVAVVAASAGTLALLIWVVRVAWRTMRYLRELEIEQDRVEGVPPADVPDELVTGTDAPRLGQRGDRVVYLVDPPDPHD